MDTLAIEREGTAIGNALFQQIIADLKVIIGMEDDWVMYSEGDNYMDHKRTTKKFGQENPRMNIGKRKKICNQNSTKYRLI